MRQLELAPHALLAEVAGDEAGVLDRRADLIGDRRDELAVAGRKRVRAEPVREIDHADRAGGTAGRRIEHRDREEGPAAVVAALAAVGRIGPCWGGEAGGVADDPHLAEGAGGHPAGGVDLDGHSLSGVPAPRGPDPKPVALLAVHQPRATP